MNVSTLRAPGYKVPGQVDAQGSYGRPGNNDGLVCAVLLGSQLTA